MNNNLKKEIILNCFNIFGIFTKNNFSTSALVEPLLNEKFLLDKKLAFELEDGKKRETSIFAASTKIENNVIKVLIADIIDNYPEYAIIIRMDNFPPIALRLSIDENDCGTIAFIIENKWIDVDTLAQGKILVGIEAIANVFCVWEKLKDWKEMYEAMINFVNFVEGL